MRALLLMLASALLPMGAVGRGLLSPRRMEQEADTRTTSLQPQESEEPTEQDDAPAAPSCDSNWCDCESKTCDKSRDQTPCNLCETKWVFIFSLGGRTGSTSLLEGINALPGVSLNGENHAVLKDMRSAYLKVTDLVHGNALGARASFLLPNVSGVLERSLCAQQQFMATLSGASPGQIMGFKELIQLPSVGKDAKQDEHFSFTDPVRPRPRHVRYLPRPTPAFLAQGWLEFLDVLFPCARIVFSLRRDLAAHARSISTAFNVDEEPLQEELAIESAKLLEWHSRRSSTGKRSFLMYQEDLTKESFNELAHWLGIKCSFSTIPDANEPDPSTTQPNQRLFHSSRTPVVVQCPHSNGTLEHYPLYQKKVIEAQEDEECAGLDIDLPHNEARQTKSRRAAPRRAAPHHATP